MAKHTIPEAAVLIQKHRSTLYRAIETGRLSCDPDGRVDTTELLRAGYTLQTPPPAADATTRRDATRQENATTQQDATVRHDATRQGGLSIVDMENAVLRRERELLQQQLDATRDMLQQQLDATRDYREQIRYLSQMLHEAQQRYDRLLEAPRPQPPAEASRYSSKPPTRGDPHAMRRRVLEVLAGHPEGLHTQAIARALGYEGDLGPTLRAMLRDKLVRRVGPGVYAVREEEHHG